MKWLKDNLLGQVLLSLSGVFAVLALVMAIIWSWPVIIETSGVDVTETDKSDAILVVQPVAAVSNFQVINEKPIFNESRLPVEEEVDQAEVAEEISIAVKDAPDVRLTGIIITPGMRIASLTPADEKQESVMAHEGQALTGEYVGWQVSAVNPRAVILESRDGQKLELDLLVHDLKIKEPPKPVPLAKSAEVEADEGEQLVDEDGQPLSRAEQIRQRIAERREELRLEQEEQQAHSNDRDARTSKYQQAIRASIEKRNREKSSEDKKDG